MARTAAPQPTAALIGLLDGSILPGEEREFGPPIIETAAIEAIASRKLTRVCTVAITSAMELPGLVFGRWATECAVVRADESKLVLRGERRVRLVSVSGAQLPFAAVVEAVQVDDKLDLDAMIRGAHALAVALGLESGASRSAARSEKLHAALLAFGRAIATEPQLREAETWPASEVLDRLARAIANGAPVEHAACELEQTLRTLASRPTLASASRQRLWSQVVEIERRLDVYDPVAAPTDDDLVASLQRRLMQAGLPKSVRDVARRELRLLRDMETNHHDYSTYTSHLDTIARLAWHPEPLPEPDMAKVSEMLDAGHAGLDKPKRRVLEYLAVRRLGGRARSTVMCLAGPPGTGKTTLARAVAESLGRKFVRVPLGGVHDEGELRGYRLTYVGAAPGRFIQGLATARSCTAVVLLDEIDKIGTDRQRSPVGALMEVLDPEQHTHFQDNYLGVPYDLSHALFICTANETDALHPALLDRLEVIELDGYSFEEKLAITRSHILPRLREESGLTAELHFDDRALATIIDGYTREAGVRQLQRALGSVHRARALATVRGTEAPANAAVSPDEIHAALGPRRFVREHLPRNLAPGIAAGLSVSADGGSVLFIEARCMRGRSRLRLTGRLGAIMRESARTALSWLRTEREQYGDSIAALDGEVHLHAPDGATPKDGPSAGIAVLVALMSAANGVPVRAGTVFTGELTLHGRVLPVGGVRAKLLGAERAGATLAIVPEDNLADVPKGLRLEVRGVRDAHAVIREAFEPVDTQPRAPSKRSRPRPKRSPASGRSA